MFGHQLTFIAIPLSLSELPTLSRYKSFYFFLKKNKPTQKGHQLKICKSFEKKKQFFLGNVSFALVKKHCARVYYFLAFRSIEFSAHFHTQLPNKSCFSSFPIKLLKIHFLVCFHIILKICFFFTFFLQIFNDFSRLSQSPLNKFL